MKYKINSRSINIIVFDLYIVNEIIIEMKYNTRYEIKSKF